MTTPSALPTHPTHPARPARPDWDQYFLALARNASTRATCDRKHVGAVLVRDHRLLASGYNGSIAGAPHCDEVGHLLVDNHCVRTVHAEANAVTQAAKHGVNIDGSTCYTTASPCWPCFKLLANAGVKKIVYAEEYRMTDEVKSHVKSVYWDGTIGVLKL